MRLTGRRLSVQHCLPHLLVSSVLVIAALSGCGSGSGDPNKNTPTPSPSASATPTPSPTPAAAPVAVTTRIVWGPRSRQVGVQTNAVGGPSSALSATLTLRGANSSGGDVVLNVNRGVLNGPQDYSSAPQLAIPGIYILTATFYANANQTGVVVGTAQASVTVLGDGNVSTTIATVGTVKSVTVAAGQVITIGQTKTIVYSALDAAGNVLAITPGSGFASIVANLLPSGGTDPVVHASANGEDVTGLVPNRANVVVSVDGVSSAVTPITIRSNVSIVINPPGTPGTAVTVGLGQAQTFTATVANDGPATGATGVFWQIVKNGATDTAGDGGTLSTTGPSIQTVFTATGNLNNQSSGTNVYVLRATSAFDTDVFVDVPLTIVSLVNVTATPNPVSLSINQTQKFTASVNVLPAGATANVVWSVQTANGGKITTTGVYTAPATVPTSGTPFVVIVRATSVFDSSKFVDIPVTIQDGILPITVN